MTKIIISLIGAKQSGKTTSAHLLQEILPDAYMTAIADKLKTELSVAYDIDLVHFHSQYLKEEPFIYPIRTRIDNLSHLIEAFKTSTKSVKIDSETLLDFATKEMKTPRDIMQVGGMLIREIFGKFVHLKHLNLMNDITIVSDVRFVNEWNYLESMRQLGYIHIPLYINNKQAESIIDLHPSEQEYKKLIKRCIKIDNNAKDLDNLWDQLRDAVVGELELYGAFEEYDLDD